MAGFSSHFAKLPVDVALANDFLVRIPGDLAGHMHGVAEGHCDHCNLCKAVVAVVE